MIRRMMLAIFIVAVSMAYGDALIDADSQDVHLGSIRQGGSKPISHTYHLRNRGKEVLRISEVKPSCGCTPVEYDSIIPPGKEGKLVAALKTGSLQDGDFTKVITVISNARNNPRLRLSLNGRILSAINISERYLYLNPRKGTVGDTVILSSQKKDLGVLGMKFEPVAHGKSPGWQSEPSYVVRYSFAPRTTQPDGDGYVEYTLVFEFDINLTEPITGTYLITTNHPEMRELRVYGQIVPDEAKKR